VVCAAGAGFGVEAGIVAGAGCGAGYVKAWAGEDGTAGLGAMEEEEAVDGGGVEAEESAVRGTCGAWWMWRRELPRWVFLLHCVLVWRRGQRI